MQSYAVLGEVYLSSCVVQKVVIEIDSMHRCVVVEGFTEDGCTLGAHAVGLHLKDLEENGMNRLRCGYRCQWHPGASRSVLRAL